MTNLQIVLAVYVFLVLASWYFSSAVDWLDSLNDANKFAFIVFAPAFVVIAIWGRLDVAFIVTMLGFVASHILMALLKSGGSSDDEQHLRGMELKIATDHKSLQKRVDKIEKQTGRRPTTIGNVPIAKDSEILNTLFCGSPKSGKSQAFHEVIEATTYRQERSIIFDESGDFVSRHYRKNDLLFNPHDQRSIGWSVMNEVEYLEDCANVANAMIPTGTGQKEEWNGYARAVVRVLLEHMYQNGLTKNSDLYEWVVTKSVEEVKQLCQGTPAQRTFESNNEKMAASVMAVMATYFEAWRFIPDGDFSVRAFVRDDVKYKDTKLFLASDAGRLKSIADTFLTMLNIAIVELNSLRADEDRRVWFFLDELPMLGQISEIDGLLTRARKRGGAAVLGLQSLGFLDTLYGKDARSTLLAGIGVMLTLRVTDQPSAKEMAAQLGNHDVIRAVRSTSDGSSSSGSSQNKGISYQTAENVDLVQFSDVMKLGDCVGFLKRAGDGRPVLLVNIPVNTRPETTEAFIPVERKKIIKKEVKKPIETPVKDNSIDDDSLDDILEFENKE